MPGFLLRSYFLLFAVWTAVQIPGQTNSSVLNRKYPVQDLQNDLRLFKEVVLAMHPSVGLYHNAAYYNELFEKAIHQIRDSMSEKSFRIYCKQLGEELHCGHTEIMGSKAYNKAIGKAHLNYSPIVFLPVKDKLYAIANLNKKQDSLLPKGAEIKTLNDIAPDSLIRYCKRFISADGYIQSSKNHFVQLGFNNLYPSLFGRPDSLRIEYKAGKSTKSYSYASIRLKNIPPLPLKKLEDTLFTSKKKSGIRYREVKSSKQYFVLKLDKFSHTAYKRTYRKLFRKLEQQNIRYLVLDLRNNGGGSLANAYTLLGYLIDSTYTQTLSTRIKKYPYKKHTKGNLAFRFTRFVFSQIGKKTSQQNTDVYTYTLKIAKKHRYTGKVYVLMNGGSFSASCLVGAYLKGRKNAVHIGEESGGTLEGCNAGVTPYYKLPATGIRVRIPAFRLSHDIHPEFTGHGIFPDYTVDYSFKDLIGRKDLELRKVEELLQNE